MSLLAVTLEPEADTRVEALDLVTSMAAIPLVTDCEPAETDKARVSDRGLQHLMRLITSPPSSRVTVPGMHICTLYFQPRQCARSESEILAVTTVRFRLTA
jgi:hypothetical protein